VARYEVMRTPPPLLALVAAVAQRGLTRGVRSSGTTGRAAAAGAIAAASGTLAATSARRFLRAGTTLEPVRPERASVLVTTGANALTRNPMYVGLTGLLVANAVRLRAKRALIPAAAFAVVIDRLQISAEEAALVTRFGADYEAYRAAVPRWLGVRSFTPRA
jgi:protein-S-isoprenylcysteine O-methyltransferase Ste14